MRFDELQAVNGAFHYIVHILWILVVEVDVGVEDAVRYSVVGEYAVEGDFSEADGCLSGVAFVVEQAFYELYVNHDVNHFVF